MTLVAGNVEQNLRPVEELRPLLPPVPLRQRIASETNNLHVLTLQPAQDSPTPAHAVLAQKQDVDVALQLQHVPVARVIANRDELRFDALLAEVGLVGAAGDGDGRRDVQPAEMPEVPG